MRSFMFLVLLAICLWEPMSASGASLEKLVIKGDLEGIQKKLTKGVKNKELSSAVRTAAHYGRLDMIKYLMASKSEIAMGTEDSVAAFQLDSAFLGAIGGCLDVLYQSRSTSASAKDYVAIMEYLLEIGAHVDSISLGPSLRRASELGAVELVELLLSMGAPVDAQEVAYEAIKVQDGVYSGRAIQGGNTALTLAVQNKHMKVAKLLLAHGADENRVVTWKDSDSENTYLSLRSLMIEANGGNVTIRQNFPPTPVKKGSAMDIAKEMGLPWPPE